MASPASTTGHPEHDPLFPRAWSDRLAEFLARFELRGVDGVGHFMPLEAPAVFAAAIGDMLSVRPEERQPP